MQKINVEAIYGAVGEIIRDQRAEIDGLLAQQKARISGLQQDIDRTRITGEDADKSIVEDMRKELAALHARLHARHEAVEKALTALEERPVHADPVPLVKELEQAVTTWREHWLAGAEKRDKAAAAEVGERFEALDAKLKEIDENVLPLYGRTRTLEERADKLSAESKAIRSDVVGGLKLAKEATAGLGARIDELPVPKDYDDEIGAIERTIAEITEGAKKVEYAVGENLKLAQTVGEKVDGLAGELATEKEASAETRQLLANYLKSIDEIKAHAYESINALTDTSKALEEQIAEASESRKSLEARVGEKLAAQREEHLEHLREKSDDLSKRIEETAKRATDIAADLDAAIDERPMFKEVDGLIERATGPIIERADNHDAQLKAVRGKADQLQTAVTDLRILLEEDGKDSDAEIKRISDALSEVVEAVLVVQERDDIDALGKGLEEAKSATHKLIESLGTKASNEDVDALRGETAQQVERAQAAIDDVSKAVAGLSETIERIEQIPGPAGKDGAGIDVKSWKPGIYRKDTVVQYAFGQYYRATKDTAEKPKSADWERVGEAGFDFIGVKPKDPAAKLYFGDLYIDDGSLFLFDGTKGRMVAQRGKPGRKGERGFDGKDGRDAVEIIRADLEKGDLKFLRDDGTTLTVGLPDLQDMIDARHKLLGQQEDSEATKFKSPIRRYRGIYDRSQSYSVGDTANHNRGLWLCHKAIGKSNGITADNWVKISGSSGGGGSIGGSSNVASPFNVVSLNLAIPRTGAANGDTYFSFQDGLLRIWDGPHNKWVFPAAIAKSYPDDTTAKASAGQPGEMHWSIGSNTMWVWEGTKWSKSSGGIKHVPDAAARIAYTPEYRGEVVVQTDTGALWHLIPLPGGGPAQWLPIMPKPTDDALLRKLEWDPSTGDRLVWRDARDDMETVRDATDLLRIPIQRLQTGKLVYVINDKKLYEFTASPTAMTRTQGDWEEVGGGGGGTTVRVVNRAADLPASTTADPIVDGDLAIVRYHADAITPLNELFVARVEARPPTVAPQGRGGVTMGDGSAPPAGAALPAVAGLGTDIAIYLQIDPAVDISGGFPITFAADQTVYLQYSDGVIDELNIAAGTYGDAVALHTGTHLVQQSSHHLRFNYVLGGDGHTYIYIVGSGGATAFGGPYPWRMHGPYPTASKPPSPVLGAAFTWVPIAERIFRKATIAGADIQDPQRNDVQITTEAGHKEIKVWDRTAGRWITIYSEDQTAAAIAAGNLFTGTAQEAGHGTAGAIDLTAMPAESALGPTDKGHYWVFVGTAGHQIAANELGGSASAIQGQVLNVGDWIQVAEPTPGTYQYSVIPGDLLSKATADSLFGLNTWVQGAYQTGTLISHQGSIYKAGVPVLATDPAPDDPTNAKWVKIPISAGVHNVPADNNLPATAPTGDVYLVVNSARANGSPAFYVFDAPSAQWLPIGGSTAATGGAGQPINLLGGELLFNIGMPIGSILMWPVDTAPNGWLICNGSAFDGNRFPILYRLLGDNHSPDLQNQFVRGAAGPLDNFAKHRWTTGRPRQDLRTDNAGSHTHSYQSGAGSHQGIKFSSWGNGEIGGNINNNTTGASPTHSHTVVSGGDNETAPDHVYLWYIIKAEDIGIDKRII